ncbi:MAG: hypothetical protein Q9222_007438, partial [Ikaeria aurantiellina]
MADLNTPTTDDSETPRPPAPKRFRSDEVNRVADQLVAPSDIFSQQQQQQQLHQYQRHPSSLAFYKQRQYLPPNATQRALIQNNNDPRNLSAYSTFTKPSMDKRHPSSFQQLEK